MTNPTLGTFGVFGLFEQWKHTTAAQLRDIEALGYGAIWEAARRRLTSTGSSRSWKRPKI